MSNENQHLDGKAIKKAREFWKEKFDEYPQNDADKLAVAMMTEYKEYLMSYYASQPRPATQVEGVEQMAFKEFENVGDEGLFPNHSDKDIWVNGFIAGYTSRPAADTGFTEFLRTYFEPVKEGWICDTENDLGIELWSEDNPKVYTDRDVKQLYNESITNKK